LTDEVGKNSFIILDKQLNKINEYSLPNFVREGVLLSSNNRIFFVSKLSVFAYNIETNQIEWKYRGEEFTIQKSSSGGYIVRIGKLYIIDDKYLAFIEGTQEDGNELVKNNSLKVLSIDNGKALQKIQLGDVIEKVAFACSDNKIVLGDHHKKNWYEKN